MADEDISGLVVSDGTEAHYYLREGYQYRDTCQPFDDQANSAEWQDHVYALAHEIAISDATKTVLDIGCGSGFKLMKYFSSFETRGLELPVFVETLRERFPERRWDAVQEDNGTNHFPPADLYICSDVIEHIRHPDAFLRRIARSPFRTLILSTPAREILYADGKRGFLTPPDNKHHHFEWTMGELHKFCAPYMEIVDHTFKYNGEYTQIIVAKQRR